MAVAGLVYELVAATAASYLLGDSVRQFSLVIGVFLSAMGVGAWASRFVGDALQGFARAQIALGLIGGATAPMLFALYASGAPVGPPLFGALAAIGALSGLELPLVARVLEEAGARAFRFENALAADYAGALAASLLFPFLVLPHLGLVAGGLLFGCLNLAVAGLALALFRERVAPGLWLAWGLAFALGAGALALSGRLGAQLDAAMHDDEVILSEATPHQRIVVTRGDGRTRLFLDGAIQFDTRDEHRYHEALVHPAMALAPRRAAVLILGGGDGMAAREALRWPDVERVTLVDLDGRVTALFRDHPDLAPLNGRALSDPRVRIVAEDAFAWAARDRGVYDVVVADLPDPSTPALSRLYSAEFYARLAPRLSPRGVLVTQAGSPVFARRAFWSVVQTLRAARSPAGPEARLRVTPYHVYVPSFGDWGFALASAGPRRPGPLALPGGLRFLTREAWDAARVFGADAGPVAAEVNTLRSHALLRDYEAGWSEWFE